MTLLKMTFSGGLMILLITVVRALAIDRLPKQTFPVLWGAALLRLLVPFSIPFQFSLFSLAERGAYAVNPSAVVTHNKGLASAARQSLLSVQTVSDRVSPWTVLWLLGLGLALLFFIAAYVWHFRRFRSAGTVDNAFVSGWLASHPLRRPISIRESGRVTAPLTYGIFRPVILVSAGIDWEDSATLDYAFAHEYTHIRRFDGLLRLFLMAALCVHWFNPLVWVMYVLALRDIELSCDEAVVRQFGLDSRRTYALALLKMEETRQRFNAFASGFSKNAAEERIRAVMKLRRITAFQVVVSAVLVIGISAALCTSAMADSGVLRESPGLIRMSMEEMPQMPRGHVGPHIWLREGSFIKLRITGRGEGVFRFFFCCDRSDEVKGQQIDLDGYAHELWLEAPVDGYYYIRTFRDYQCADGADDHYTYQVNYTCYAADGEPLGVRCHRGSMFSGVWTTTYTYTND